MNIFDIIGPIMVGPSSSHTAGAARIGLAARTALGHTPDFVRIKLHGSFAHTYKGHATDRAVIGGLLGFEPEDTRIRESLEIAGKSGMAFEFIPVDIPGAHPNTIIIEAIGVQGLPISLRGESLGGGIISTALIPLGGIV